MYEGTIGEQKAESGVEPLIRALGDSVNDVRKNAASSLRFRQTTGRWSRSFESSAMRASMCEVRWLSPLAP